MSTILIPADYETAIQAAIEASKQPLSRITVKQVLDKLPATLQDSVDASFYLKKYKKQNKPVSKLQKLLDAINSAMEELDESSNAYTLLNAALTDFTRKPNDEDSEF